ncbi:MAG: cardiolipin synthase [Lachnospiraceae bacterium]|nr:cardiolipin synthase [Lachnospiraceae bacterium]
MSISNLKPYEKKKTVKNGIMRVAFTVFAGMVEISFLLFLLFLGNYYWKYFSIALRLISTVVCLMIYSQARTANLKMPWLIFILTMPSFGLLMYVFVGLSGSFLGVNKRYTWVEEYLQPYWDKDSPALNRFAKKDPDVSGIARYLQKNQGFPVYDRSEIRYYKETTDCLEQMLKDLEQAKEFIFMEYYAIEDSLIFERILNILKKKTEEGILVRIFYDDLGSVSFVDLNFAKKIKKYGIECRTFNPFFGPINTFLNNRDHRKIMVIDGKIGYTGGFNLADEYFHLTEPYGEWKDAGVRIVGDAVRSLTLIFLENWNALKKKDRHLADRDVEKFLKKEDVESPGEGFIQPYSDNPFDNEQVGENVYINLASKANEYIYFSTPYLIITEEMVSALTLAAKRGVDVRIVTPGIPDKKTIYSMTRSYYHMLAREGVRIFEYTPGFNHSKLCVMDDTTACCGSFNLDYRSFYHNFEDGCIFYHCRAVSDVKEDLLEMMGKSVDVTEKYVAKRAGVLRLWQMLLRLFTPLF